MIAILFGVSGAGKTTLGQMLADELGWKFYEGDDFHPRANIDKMRAGEPLTDNDRQPWLETLRGLIEQCLAAKRNAVRRPSSRSRRTVSMQRHRRVSYQPGATPQVEGPAKIPSGLKARFIFPTEQNG